GFERSQSLASYSSWTEEEKSVREALTPGVAAQDGQRAAFSRRSVKNLNFENFIETNIAPFTYGVSMAWPSAAIPQLMSKDNPIDIEPITAEDGSWLGGILCLGALAALPIFSYMADRFGRKIAGYAVGIPFILGWILKYFANSVEMLFIARFIVGLSSGGMLIVCPLYVAEIAEDSIRGTLGSFLLLFVNSGMLMSYVIGAFISYHGFAILGCIFPILYLGAFYWLPETPVFLITKDRQAEALSALKWLRGSNSELIEEELENLTRIIRGNTSPEKVHIKDLISTRAARMGLIIGLVLCINQQFCGIYAIASYAGSIFEASGSDIKPQVATIIVGAIQLLGSFASTSLMDRAGRRILVTISNASMALCLLGVGVYFYLKHIQVDTSMGPVPFVMISEILSPQIRGLATWICISVLWFLAFCVGKFFNTVSEALGIYVCFWFFAFCCCAGAIFDFLVLPETKGKSIEAILEELSGGSRNGRNQWINMVILCYRREKSLEMSNTVQNRINIQTNSSETSSNQKSKIWRTRSQYMAALIVSLTQFLLGNFTGWPSPAIVALQSENPPIGDRPITNEEASWIGSLMFLGFLFGAPLYSYIADKFGRKPACLLIAVPAIVHWILIIFGETVFIILVARFICGISMAGTLTIVPIYIGEISEAKIRGQLGSFMGMFGNAGNLCSYVIGSYVSYHKFAWIMLCFPLLFLISFMWMPETPTYLVKKGELRKAKHSLEFFRKIDDIYINEELAKISLLLNEINKRTSGIGVMKDLFHNKGSRCALIIGIVVTATFIFSGTYVILSYNATIFEMTGANIPSHICSIIVGALSLVTSILVNPLMERAGRKVLLITTLIGMGTCLIVLGFYFYLQQNGTDVSSIGFIPVTSLGLYIICMSGGILPVNHILLSELFLPHVRSTSAGISIFLKALFSFIVTRFYNNLSDAIGVYGSFWFFSVCCFLGVVFAIVYIPETKNRTIESIHAELEGGIKLLSKKKKYDVLRIP
ncbi:hypothetical protein C0J52_07385, partial [Blattella germanica]